MPRNLFKTLFVMSTAWPLTRLWLRLSVRYLERLPRSGPAIVAANHNSHLDTLALLALFPLSLIPKVRPVAASDYFMRSRFKAWLSRTLLGVIPVKRDGHLQGGDPLHECYTALDRGEILIIFPEGTRGVPEQMTSFRAGIARIARRRPDVPIIPAFLRGFGKSMPKGAYLPLPVASNIVLGEPFFWTGRPDSFMEKLLATFNALRTDGRNRSS
jgi:1-acyl-sn-glycerol-3-phosphate acyltransferase